MKNKKIDKKTEKVIKELEEIDDELDEHYVLFLKTHDPNASKGNGIDVFPTLVFFDRMIPNIYHGDLLNEDEVLAWLVRQKTSEEIEEITEEMLKELVAENQKIVVLFCKFTPHHADERKHESLYARMSYRVFRISRLEYLQMNLITILSILFRKCRRQRGRLVKGCFGRS